MGLYLTGARLLRRIRGLNDPIPRDYSSPGWYNGREGGRAIQRIANEVGVSIDYRGSRMTIADMELVESEDGP